MGSGDLEMNILGGHYSAYQHKQNLLCAQDYNGTKKATQNNSLVSVHSLNSLLFVLNTFIYETSLAQFR